MELAALATASKLLVTLTVDVVDLGWFVTAWGLDFLALPFDFFDLGMSAFSSGNITKGSKSNGVFGWFLVHSRTAAGNQRR